MPRFEARTFLSTKWIRKIQFPWFWNFLYLRGTYSPNILLFENYYYNSTPIVLRFSINASLRNTRNRINRSSEIKIYPPLEPTNFFFYPRFPRSSNSPMIERIFFSSIQNASLFILSYTRYYHLLIHISRAEDCSKRRRNSTSIKVQQSSSTTFHLTGVEQRVFLILLPLLLAVVFRW